MRASLTVSLLVLATACGGGGTEPPAASSIVAITTNPLPSVVVGSAIGSAPTFEVRSADGRALAGVQVSVAVTAGGGSLTGAPTVSLAGPTPIGQWTLGTTSGTQSVTVSAGGVTPLVFTVVASAAAPTQFAIVDGDDQFGTQGAPIPAPLRVRARDQFNNPVAGATVTWAVDAGGGSLGATSSVTDANGIAVAPTWTLGTIAAGEQAVVATLGALTARFTATAQLAPASITVEQGVPASATVFTLLTPNAAFAVRDANGTALQGVPVTVAITAGTGTLTAPPTVSALGATSIGAWRLGQTAGTQTVTVTVSGITPRTFTVNAVPDVPSQLAVEQGSGQSGLAGATLPTSLRVRLADQYGNGIAGQNITFGVSAGGGTLAAGGVRVSNASGSADAGAWTLGRRGGPQTVTVTSLGFQQTFTATIQTNFNVTLRFAGTAPTGDILAAFESAAVRIGAMIVSDVADVQIGNNSQPFQVADCGNPAVTGISVNEVVDDVVIYAAVVPIDGVGQVLGSAGPCLTRNAGGLPALGTMRLDNADLSNLANNGRLGDVILHEMLHVVGLGTLWNARGLLADTGTTTPKVTGAQALAACVNSLGGATACPGYVPAENCLDLNPGTSCGSGTRLTHWKESTFQTELMTGYAGAVNTLSLLTVQGLADLGYGVNQLAADAYVVPSLMALLEAEGDLPEARAPLIALPPPLLPRFTLERDGRVRPLFQR